MYPMDLERIRERLSKKHQDEIENIISIISKYNLKVTVRNFDQFGCYFRDEQKRKVRIVSGNIRNGFIHTIHPNADIAVIFIDSLLSGWIETVKMEDLQDRMSVNVQSLHQMPEIFSFNQQCPHLDVYGGFYEGEYWECAGCGERLVFSDN